MALLQPELNDSAIEAFKIVIPAPACGRQGSGNPDAVPRIKYGAGSAKLVPRKTGSRELHNKMKMDSCLHRNDDN